MIGNSSKSAQDLKDIKGMLGKFNERITKLENGSSHEESNHKEVSSKNVEESKKEISYSKIPSSREVQ